MTDNKSGEILIIEDDKDINDLLATALSKAGYRTRQAWSVPLSAIIFHSQPNLLFLHNIIVRVRELYVFLSNPLIII